MFREALDFPTRPPAGGRAILVGGGLLILIASLGVTATFTPPWGFLATLAILPWLLVRGYYVRVVRTTIGHDRPVPPRFDRVGRLFHDGLAAVVVTIVYVLPAVLVVAPLAFVQVTTPGLEMVLREWGLSEIAVAAVLAGSGALAIVALMYLIAALYALPVAVAHYAYESRLVAAFDIRSVVTGAYSEDYVVAWVVSLLLQLLVLPVAYLFRAILIGFFLHIFVMMGVRYCYGRGVGDALEWEPLDVDRPTDARSIHRRAELTPAVRRIDGDGWRGASRTERRHAIPAIRRVDDDVGR